MQTHKQTTGFQQLWHWTERATDVYRSKYSKVDLSALHAPLLDINPEGALQREIKDIIDELDIMLHITRQQKDVIKRFIRHAERMMDPKGTLSDLAWDMGSDDTRP